MDTQIESCEKTIDNSPIATPENQAKEEKPKKVKNKWRRVKSLTPYSRIVPYIMENRVGSQNFAYNEIDMDIVDKYLKKKQEEGFKGISLMHLIIAGYIRTVSQYPAINRFIRGQKIYTRNLIEISLVIKKEMALDSPDTVLKFLFEPNATIDDVYHVVNDKISEYRNEPDSSFDKLAKVLNFIPGIFLRWTIRFLRFLDYCGLLPKKLTSLSPFHASFFVTSMGSLGVPPIVHHLYDFGTLPVFCSFGIKEREYKIKPDGTVYRHNYVEVTYNLDERICDGFYYASALKYLHTLFKHPEKLDVPPETIVEDIK